MEINLPDVSRVHPGIIGALDFQRRLNSALVSADITTQSFTASSSDAWSKILSDRPNAVVFEIGLRHSDRHQAWLRGTLEQIRERFGNSIYVIIALTAPEKLVYGGDLLFSSAESSEPSGLVDTFIASPPGGIPSIPDLAEQLINSVKLFSHELTRRSADKTPIPPLGADNWVQSLADPKSRELWMLWLPRYATYTNENPLITGLTGTGKTRLSRAIHLLSDRPGPFVSMTPRDFSSSELIQAELFGAVAGAYTGAVDKWGLVKSAEQGTLFIDELQSIDKDLQGKLITFVENKSYRRVGSAETTQADVRFTFATNRPIDELVESDVLRDDFAYRLQRVQLELHPLRTRRLDICAALAHALAKIRRERPQTDSISGLSSTAYRMLFSHDWPGNLRQLENTVAQLCEFADVRGSRTIDDVDVSHVFDSQLSGIAGSTAEVIAQAAHRLARHSLQMRTQSLDEGVERLIEEARTSALESAGGDPSRAAELIGESSNLMEIFAEAQSANNTLQRMKPDSE